MSLSQEMGIIILCAVAVGSIWYLWIQVPRNRRERNRETLRKFMERQDAEILALMGCDSNAVKDTYPHRTASQSREQVLSAAATATRMERS